MIQHFSESIMLLKDTSAAHNFWREKIHELYDDREKGMEFEREIIDLIPGFKKLLSDNKFSLQPNHRLFDFEKKWDSEDGNPIFYGYVPKTFRAIRIIQAPPEDTTNQLGAWVEKSFTNFSEDIRSFDATGSYELVIYIEMNNLTYYNAMLLIYFWISRRAVKPRHEELLIEKIYNTRIRGNDSSHY